eukprot:Selendium_serpulae@DN6079_c0_g1_i16.p2
MLLWFISLLLVASIPWRSKGQVVTLTSDEFDTAIQDGTWLVKFYTPRCKHCQTLEPHFLAAARELEQQHPKHYVRFEYTSPSREKENILAFAKNLSRNPPVISLESLDDLDGWMKQYQVGFVYLHASGTDVHETFSYVARSRNNKHFFASMECGMAAEYGVAPLPCPRIIPFGLCVESSTFLDMSGLLNHPEDRLGQEIMKFVDDNRYPVVSKLTYDNFFAFSQASLAAAEAMGKRLMVLALPEGDAFQANLDLFKIAASKYFHNIVMRMQCSRRHRDTFLLGYVEINSKPDVLCSK